MMKSLYMEEYSGKIAFSSKKSTLLPTFIQRKQRKKDRQKKKKKKPQKIEKNQIGAILLYEKINQLLLLL